MSISSDAWNIGYEVLGRYICGLLLARLIFMSFCLSLCLFVDGLGLVGRSVIVFRSCISRLTPLSALYLPITDTLPCVPHVSISPALLHPSPAYVISGMRPCSRFSVYVLFNLRNLPPLTSTVHTAVR